MTIEGIARPELVEGRARGSTSSPRAGLVAVTIAVVTLASAAAGPTFTDVTTSAGIRFKHNSGAFGKKYLPETMGSGVAFFDAGSPGALADALVRVHHDPAAARQRTERAAERFEQYRWSVQKQAYLGVYESLAEATGARSPALVLAEEQ